MSSSYEYTPYVWPMVISIGFTAAVGIYSWRHRTVPGATGLAFMMFFWSLKLLATTLGLTAGQITTKLLWFEIERFFLLPSTVAGLAFALEYAGLDTWLNRRTVALLAIPALLLVPLTFTNDSHQLIWTRMWFDGRIRFDPGAVVYPLWGYGLLLGGATISIFIWLFIRSPLHRWPVGLILLNLFAGRLLFYLTEAGLNPVKSLDLFDMAAIFICPVYFVALFHFRMFEVVPVARNRVIEQMRDGMLVLDAQTRVVDLNGAAQQLLGVNRSELIGRGMKKALEAYPSLVDLVLSPTLMQDDIWLSDTRCCRVHISPLSNRRGFELGKLVLLYDTSEEKRTQRQLQDHQRKLATLEEREWLARELHDGVGQILAAAHLEIKTAAELLGKGQVTATRASLDRIATVIREGKAHVGDYMLGVKSWSSNGHFFNGLRQYVMNYSRNGGVLTELIIPAEIEKRLFGETIETQLHRIIQEALTNIRKHANARSARVIFGLENGHAKITIEDDGQGFNIADLDGNQGFGLRSMKGRAETVGAQFEVKSSPGNGTKVIVQVPLGEMKP